MNNKELLKEIKSRVYFKTLKEEDIHKTINQVKDDIEADIKNNLT